MLRCFHHASHSYPLVGEIPILMKEDPSTGQPSGEEIAAIRQAFRARSSTYYEDNYGAAAQGERFLRLEKLRTLLRDVVGPETKVLDAGAGPAVLAEEVIPLASSYLALDASLDNLLAGKARVPEAQAIVGSLTNIPFEDASFDVVVASGCLEYVADWEAALAELCRVVKSQGRLIATFANSASPRRWWDETVTLKIWAVKERLAGREQGVYGRHLTGEEEAVDLLRRYGAVVETIDYFNQGLFGYPLSSLRFVDPGYNWAAGRWTGLQRRSSEFMIVAVKQ